MDAPRQTHRLTRRPSGPVCVLAATVAALVLRCAHVEPPPGGPVDTTPPLVVAAFPAPGARDVPQDAAVALQFSEWIERDVRGHVLLSPPLPGKLKPEVDGDRLRLRFSSVGGLQPNTAYRLTLMKVKDLHGVVLAKPFSLAFTTGGGFDSGHAASRVFTSDRRGMMLAALYRPDSSSSDVWHDLPAFLAPADSTGNFVFDSVAQGDYALLAFADLNGNFRPDPEFEPVGMGWPGLSLRPRARETQGGLRLAMLDTLPLRKLSVRFVLDTAHGDTVAGSLRVKFNRPANPNSAANPKNYRLVSTSSLAESLAVTEAGWDAAGGEWVLPTPDLKTGAHYQLKIKGVTDLSGMGMYENGDTALFTVEAPPHSDTAAWTLAFLNAPDASGLVTVHAPSDLLPGGDFRLRSSRLLTPGRWSMLEERLEAKADTARTKPVLRRIGPMDFFLRLRENLRSGQVLRLRLKPAAPDTVFRLLASGLAADSLRLGSFGFRIPRPWTGWTFLLQATGSAERALAPVAVDSVFSGPLPAGWYRLAAFLDRDGDGLWHPGCLRPWTAQESFAIPLDSVQVVGGASVDLTARLGTSPY